MQTTYWSPQWQCVKPSWILALCILLKLRRGIFPEQFAMEMRRKYPHLDSVGNKINFHNLKPAERAVSPAGNLWLLWWTRPWAWDQHVVVMTQRGIECIRNCPIFISIQFICNLVGWNKRPGVANTVYPVSFNVKANSFFWPQQGHCTSFPKVIT